MKKVLLLSCFIFSCLFTFAQDKGFLSLSADGFEKAIADSSVVVIDVRTSSEYESGHIPSAKYNIDVLKDDFLFRIDSIVELKGRTLAVYCKGGSRSKKAAKLLVGNGYAVIELDCGYTGWVSAGKQKTPESVSGVL